MRLLMIVGIGGFLGTVCRYLVQLWAGKVFPLTFPYGTLTANISGCLLIGIIYSAAGRGNLLTAEWRLFLTTGFCGGFTTFSAFSYENFSLLTDGQLFYAALNILVSVIVGLTATFLGVWIGKMI